MEKWNGGRSKDGNLSWVILSWMALFAAIIFGEKIWIKGGTWIARSAGIGFVILGVLALIGIIEIPTGDMTMTDVTSSNNKDMEMYNGINMGMGMEIENTNDDNNM